MLTRIMPASEDGREMGQVFPFAGGSSMKSIQSPERTLSLNYLVIGGKPKDMLLGLGGVLMP